MTRSDTKQKIMEHGARLIHMKGFNHTGIQEILQAAGVPKGSFYFYFKSKEEFGLALVDYHVDRFDQWVDTSLAGREPSPLNRLRSFFAGLRESFKHNECRGGCPIGNLTQEMGDLSEAYRVKLRNALERMTIAIGRCIELAQRAGEVDQSLNPYETAAFLLNSWEGALLRMKAEGSTGPLETFERMVFARVLR